MKKSLKIAILILITTSAWAQNTTLPQEVKVKGGPFWLNKTKIMNKVTKEREILVSVKSSAILPAKTNKKQLVMQGVGIVNSPLVKAFSKAKNFSNLPKVSDHIKEVQYDASSQKLFMHSVAFNYHARMWMDVRLQEEKQKKQIHFVIVKGVFAGMKGTFRFLESAGNKSQIELVANYNYAKLAIPRFFVEFGLEVIIRKIAERMRNFIEKTNQRAV